MARTGSFILASFSILILFEYLASQSILDHRPVSRQATGFRNKLDQFHQAAAIKRQLHDSLTAKANQLVSQMKTPEEQHEKSHEVLKKIRSCSTQLDAIDHAMSDIMVHRSADLMVDNLQKFAENFVRCADHIK